MITHELMTARRAVERMATLRVAVVEPRTLVRRGLEKVLAGGAALRVAATAAGPSGLDPRCGRFDVVVAGLPPHPGGVETVASLAEHGAVLVLSDFDDGPRVTDVLRAGAYGCVTERAGDGEILRAVEAVGRGGFHVSPALADRLRTELCRPSATVPSVLGRREVETLRWLATGLTHGQIARRMGLTEATVSTYVKRIRAKLNVGNKADLTRIAIEWGLLDPAGGPVPPVWPAA